MQYALMFYADPAVQETHSEEQRDEARAGFAELIENARFVTGMRLQPVETATSVRMVEGRTLITDGPFADTKEVLGGFALIEADNLDQAIDLAAGIVTARFGGTVEVRPVVPR